MIKADKLPIHPMSTEQVIRTEAAPESIRKVACIDNAQTSVIRSLQVERL